MLYVLILMKHTRIATVLKYQWVRNTFPNLMGRSYLSHIKYRLGAYYTTPYYKIGGKRLPVNMA